MTQEYSEALARDAFALLKGFEKHILPGGTVRITISPTGQNYVEVFSSTVSGAVVAHTFLDVAGRVRYDGTYTKTA